MQKYKKILKEMAQKRQGLPIKGNPHHKDITEKYNFGYEYGWYSWNLPTEKQLRAAINRKRKAAHFNQFLTNLAKKPLRSSRSRRSTLSNS